LVRSETGDVVAVDAHHSGAAGKACNRIDKGRLAGAVGADQADKLTRVHL
jgi:hypothetical protein